MRELCQILEKQHLLLTDFQIDNNRTIGNSPLSDMFASISTANRLQTLNLSNCGVSECDWARYLCFVEALSYLNLSHNAIADDAFVELMKSVDHCHCLRHLDLSYNLFGGIKCNVLQHSLSTNRGLFSLNLAGNRLDSTVWASISMGLMDIVVDKARQSSENANKFPKSPLTLLDVSCCRLSLAEALKLCECFQRNNTLSIVMNGNPLPAELMADPRGYCMSDVFKVAPTLEGARYLPLDREAAVADGANDSSQWRRERAKGVKESLASLEVAAQARISMEAKVRARASPAPNAANATEDATQHPSALVKEGSSSDLGSG